MSTTTPSPSVHRRPSLTPTGSFTKPRSPTRPSTPSTMIPNGATRTKNIKSIPSNPTSARANAKKLLASASQGSMRGEDNEAKPETAALLEELKSQLRKAETASEEYQKQLLVLQSRLDDAMGGQLHLEEVTQNNLEKIEFLQNENKKAIKQNREIERMHAIDQNASLREIEHARERESELNSIVQRLKESLPYREPRKNADANGRLSRTASPRGGSSPSIESRPLASPTLDPTVSSQSNSNIILQKDKVIESLRLELADAHFKLVEVENAAGGHLQDLEKVLLETRMSNAKLTEDNESYQVLLQEKTLNGDFTRGALFHSSGAPSEWATISRATSRDATDHSLADELETANVNTDNESLRRLENEVSGLKDQNKALTLYINKIITRLLQSDSFENVFDSNDNPGPATTVGQVNEKELPQTPGDDVDRSKENAPPSLLQRAGSIFGGRPRPRPQSFQASQTPRATDASAISTIEPSQAVAGAMEMSSTAKPMLTTNENPATAPSLPLRPMPSSNVSSGGRAHRRGNSEVSASIVHNMYRGPNSGSSNISNGRMGSPTGLGSPRHTSVFVSTPPPPLILESDDTAEPTNDIADHRLSNGATTNDSGYGESIAGHNNNRRENELPDPPSPQRSTTASSTDGRPTGGTVFSSQAGLGNKMRPLRLVQEKEEADEAAQAERKKAKSGGATKSTFMGWFGRGGPPPGPTLLQPQRSPNLDGRRASGGS